jgi:Sec-independent protein translocase protein TatA
MSSWGAIIVVLVAVLLVAAVMTRGGKAGRELRRELRRLRKEEGRQPDTASAADLRRGMMIDPMPGKDSTPGGI